ncbi:DUF952 domain-containing protein [Actinocatenispora rupis]|uniref:DUF952 domain-containing protein n=1 Tax=Actinocatenispora rupis TaxID=519421 RepID=A0A8J3J4Q3_9ACTN|nr:DUF952 domain-containing protein [Actinocatenispora rupis]GID14670.1 hypothetical protein Aru02nite_55590 [Actinocatenispora rupis]
MIYHVAPRAAWQSAPDRPYAPASLAEEGFVHCSPDEATTVAVVNAFYRAEPDLVVLLLDERGLAGRVEWERADPVPPPGVAADVPFPHLYGPIDRTAVARVLRIEWDDAGRAVRLTT